MVMRHGFQFVLILFLACSGLSSNTAQADQRFTLVVAKPGLATIEASSFEGLVLRKGDRVSITDGSLVWGDFLLSSVRRASSGNRLVTGISDEGEVFSVAYSARGDVQGSIRVGNEYRRVFSSDRGLQVLEDDGSFERQRFDSGAYFPPRLPEKFVKNKRERSQASMQRLSVANESQTASYPTFQAGMATLDLLIYYEEGFQEDPSVVADFLIEETNRYLSNSKIDLRVSLAGLQPLAISAAEEQGDVLRSMYRGESPFTNIASDRAYFGADVVFALRQNRPEGDDACGVAYVGVQDGLLYRDSAVSSVHWKPLGSSADRSFCSDSTFAHELGHVMGSLHERRLYEDGEYGAYQFSFGHFETGLQGWKTIMSYGDEPEYPYFSNPDIRECRYKPCGVPPQAAEAADNATGFGNVAHAMAAMESSAFVSDSLIDYRITESCETDSGEEGTLRGHGVVNSSAYDVEIVTFTELNEDGSETVYPYGAGDFTVASGRYPYLGDCLSNKEPHYFGNQVTASWYSYRNPATGRLVDGPQLPWEEGYSGSYSTLRIATAEGGTVSGHTARVVKPGEPVELAFSAKPGFQFSGATGTCDMIVDENVVLIESVDFDCRVEPSYEQQGGGSDVFRMTLEEPVNGEIHSGVGNLRGWAVASAGITKVEIFIDGVYEFDAPYGASRGDVGDAFPDVENSTNSGYSLSYAYSLLSAGEHSITAVAHSELGEKTEVTNMFTVVKFSDSDFIAEQDAINLNSASCSVRDDEILLIDALVEDLSYDVTLKWRTATQGFEIIEVR